MVKKTFEEEFPSLKGLVDWRVSVPYESDMIFNTEKEQQESMYSDESYTTVNIDSIREHCLDKQRVQETLETYFNGSPYKDTNLMHLNDPNTGKESDHKLLILLKKELGLE